ncbi:MAG: twin-arginine translocation signal domain-containing protein [Mycobacterium sp.]
MAAPEEDPHSPSYPRATAYPPEPMKGTVAMSPELSSPGDPQLIARLAAGRTSRRRFIGGSAAAAAGLHGPDEFPLPLSVPVPQLSRKAL